MSGGCTRPCTVLLERNVWWMYKTMHCTIEKKCLVDVQDHALYYWKELKCLVDVQGHALSHNKCMGFKNKNIDSV